MGSNMRHWITTEVKDAERHALKLIGERDAARAELAKAIRSLDAANAPNVALMQDRNEKYSEMIDEAKSELRALLLGSQK